MRYTIIYFFISFLFPIAGFSQKKSKLQPANSVQIDSNKFIGQTEITNRMYREFVESIKDSIITRILYDSLPDAQAVKFLAVSQRALKKVSPEKRVENEKNYSLDYTAYKTKFLADDSLAKEILKRQVYYPISLRFYFRYEVDIRKLVYKLNENELVTVFPDTLSWVNDYYVKYKPDSASFSSSWANDLQTCYFWHPAYDNYPVVGLNLAQINAYCHWYARQLNKYSKDPAISYSVSIPEIQDYTAAMKLCVPEVIQANIGPENLINPIVYSRQENQAEPHIHPAYQNFRPAIGLKTAEAYVIQEWVENNATSPTCPPDRRVLNLLGGTAEVVKSTKEPDYMTVLGGDYYLGIVDPNGIQANTLFYERLLYKEQGYSFVGFRILVTTNTKL